MLATWARSLGGASRKLENGNGFRTELSALSADAIVMMLPQVEPLVSLLLQAQSGRGRPPELSSLPWEYKALLGKLWDGP